jgi:hypothetical protein
VGFEVRLLNEQDGRERMGKMREMEKAVVLRKE